jgi:DNA-nicking Smr family endonuclease
MAPEPPRRLVADAADHSDDPEEPVELPIEDALDLHSFRPADVPSVVEEYLRQAQARGFREVRLIHGRGIGVQRAMVQSLLGRHPLVAGFADAPEDRGGRGATLVRLRPA